MKLLVALAALLLAACSSGGEPQIVVRDAWARATAPGHGVTAVYMTIENRGGASDRLTDVSSTAAVSATIHETTTENGVARMRQVANGVEVGAGETVKFEPQGRHIMVTGLAKPLAAGQILTLDARFERSGIHQVPIKVVAGTADGMAGREVAH